MKYLRLDDIIALNIDFTEKLDYTVKQGAIFMNKKIFSGHWGKHNCHCQGMAMDTQRKYVYYSFTTKVVKTDLYGNVIGTVGNILGHLGCIDYCDEDGKLYASLEYKQDKIGKDILALLGCENVDITEGFFIAIFDVEKITRLDMDAEKDDVMRVVRLKTVEEDFKGINVYDGKEYAHRYGCSGIDGVTIGPDFGCAKNSKKYLHVCYGIYGDVEREDNDHQIILQYDFYDWWKKAQRLQRNFLKDAYEEKNPRNKYFVYTGNTTYGVQNLEYDEYTGDYFAFVYAGRKAQFPNYNTFFIDGAVKPKWQNLKGKNVEGWELSLRKSGRDRSGSTGIYFSYGSMGAYSLGDGRFYFVEPDNSAPENTAVNAVLYQLIENDNEWTFERL